MKVDISFNLITAKYPRRSLPNLGDPGTLPIQDETLDLSQSERQTVHSQEAPALLRAME